MPCSIPDVDDLDDATSRGYVRERIAAADVALLQLEAVNKLMRDHRLADSDDHNMLSDVRANLECNRDRMQNRLDIAMGLEQQRAPRRASEAMVERVRV